MKFSGTDRYVATDELKLAVNAAITLERPLLIKGEPGTGKTLLAEEVARAIDAPLFTWHVKSTTKAQQGLYEYDAVSRLRDSQLGDPRVQDVGHYIKRGKMWEAFDSEQRAVLLIDEIDKADIEFPNDLLLELDRMEFHVYETGETIRAAQRPVVIITSNNEKELPDAFLRYARKHRRRAFSKDRRGSGFTRTRNVFRTSRNSGPEEETLNLRVDRLAQAAAGRPDSAVGAARARCRQGHTAAVRRLDQERTGRPVA